MAAISLFEALEIAENKNDSHYVYPSYNMTSCIYEFASTFETRSSPRYRM